jgi:pilus assembly protein CpaB
MVASGEVRVPRGTNPVEERRLLLAVANRPIDTNTTFTTGGDVSRFQRRSVPGRVSSSSDNPTDALTSFAKALRGDQASDGTAGAGPSHSGPVVRVARGNTITVVPVGAR